MRLRILRSIFNTVRDKIQNSVNPTAYARRLGVNFGKGCQFFAARFGSEPYLVTLGDHVVATNTSFITHDGALFVMRDRMPEDEYFAPIKVGNNVFLGYGSIIMPGVTIGDNVVIGAGAVVTKDIPSDCIAVGSPAKPIKTFEEYYQGLIGRTVKTHSMTAEEKKVFLLAHFKMSAKQGL